MYYDEMYNFDAFDDETVRRMEKALRVDYSYTTWEEARNMIIEDWLEAVKTGRIKDTLGIGAFTLAAKIMEVPFKNI